MKRKPSRWAVQRTENVINRMERVYGKGLTGMMKNGRVDPTTFGWDNRHTGGAQLGSSVNKLFG